MKLTALFLLFAVVASSSADFVDPEWALSRQMIYLENAVKNENKDLLLRVFFLEPGTDKQAAEVFAAYRDLSFNVAYATIDGGETEIFGTVYLIETRPGGRPRPATYTMRKSASSPTGWIIVESHIGGY